MRRITMHKIREVLRLKYLNKLSNRQIETMTGVSRSSVSNYLKVRETLEMELDELLGLSDAVLHDLFNKKTLSPDFTYQTQTPYLS